MPDQGPPPPINSENIVITRSVDPVSKQVVTRRVDKTTGEQVGLSETWHLQGVQGHFIDPPPS
jgi:hypothetical protein